MRLKIGYEHIKEVEKTNITKCKRINDDKLYIFTKFN